MCCQSKKDEQKEGNSGHRKERSEIALDLCRVLKGEERDEKKTFFCDRGQWGLGETMRVEAVLAMTYKQRKK